MILHAAAGPQLEAAGCLAAPLFTRPTVGWQHACAVVSLFQCMEFGSRDVHAGKQWYCGADGASDVTAIRERQRDRYQLVWVCLMSLL